MSSRALVLFSGGQDSTVCLAWALTRFKHVETVGFTYGQRHSVEIECRKTILAKFPALFPEWAGHLGPDHVLDIPVLAQMGETALTSETEIVMEESGLPSTFVPGRNLVFLTLAAALGYRRGITEIVGGMCETDYSGYPDCRAATLTSLEQSINLGMEGQFTIHTPLMRLNKAETWALAKELGGQPLIDFIITDTHTCYLGSREKLHAWGYGCGTCPACGLRKKGYEEFTRA